MFGYIDSREDGIEIHRKAYARVHALPFYAKSERLLLDGLFGGHGWQIACAACAGSQECGQEVHRVPQIGFVARIGGGRGFLSTI